MSRTGAPAENELTALLMSAGAAVCDAESDDERTEDSGSVKKDEELPRERMRYEEGGGGRKYSQKLGFQRAAHHAFTYPSAVKSTQCLASCPKTCNCAMARRPSSTRLRSAGSS